MLHTVNKSPPSSNSLESALGVAAPGSPILLLEDGVFAARPGTSAQGLLASALASHPVYALGPDLEARGIHQVVAGVRVIDFEGFVELVEQHPVVPWL